MKISIETEQEVDGRWIAETIDLPGVMAYGETRDEAASRVVVLSTRILGDLLENGESITQ